MGMCVIGGHLLSFCVTLGGGGGGGGFSGEIYRPSRALPVRDSAGALFSAE